MFRPMVIVTLGWTLALTAAQAGFDDRFELPPGFHIYRAASADLSGGSYSLTLDGEGRLLVGDGNAIRRLIDKNSDGVFDGFEVIATGLGPRGPQGLLVYGERLYAVGGDGIQLFEGYRGDGPPVHRGRVGNPFKTGGDHDAHTILRGHDGWIYFMAGNGAGVSDRHHINQESSPALFEREASVFRFSPDGAKWECLSSGGRNLPNLGMNSLGDLFSFDSDMEWHVGLPWYRPVRLNHWAIGGDQGWQEVGAYPPYFIDCLPGILDVGRGSPTWGVFYEHTQLPEKFRDAFLVCDYRWKRESNDQYATTGRLIAFFLKRVGAGWNATMETIVRPRSGARDEAGRLINFALVDVAVAPDGSLLLSDHNQGLWRLFYDPRWNAADGWPALSAEWPALTDDRQRLLTQLLTLPQPASERTLLREIQIRERLGAGTDGLLLRVARDGQEKQIRRLRAVRLLAPDFSGLPQESLEALARDSEPEMRAQAAWLFGLRGTGDASKPLIQLLDDADPFVRRRAAESLSRIGSFAATPGLIERLADPERLVRYVAMNALAHRPTTEWIDSALAKSPPQVRLRALTASVIRREPPPDDKARPALEKLLADENVSREDRLDLLRVLALFRKVIDGDRALREKVAAHLLRSFPDTDRDIRWEQARAIGEFRVGQGFGQLLGALENERDPVTQFHFAQALARLPEGWTADEETRAMRWLLGTQRGWFAEFDGKGVEFPESWETVLTEFGEHHRKAVIRETSRIALTGALGAVAINLLASPPSDGQALIGLYRTNSNLDVRLKIVKALGRVRNEAVADFLQAEHDRLDANSPADAKLGGAILQNWAAHPDESILSFLIFEGLFHDNPAVVRACSSGIALVSEQARAVLSTGRAEIGHEPQDDLAMDLINRLIERPELFHALEKVLVIWSGKPRPGYQPDVDLKRRPDEAIRTAALEYWKRWFEQRFHQEFKPSSDKTDAEKTDEEVHKFLLTDSLKGGDAARGGKVYESVQCNSCHGGGVTPGREGRLFGPDFAGVTRRLSRQELADALVYPSRQVADRFKAIEVTLKEGTVWTGFITEQTAESITLADRDQVRRLVRNTIASMQPQAASLMPERLLNRLSWEEIRDLMAFMEEGAARSPPDKAR